MLSVYLPEQENREMDAEPNATRASNFPLPHILQPGEVVESQAQADGFLIAVTGQRVIVTDGSRPVMDTTFGELRRIQFDVERRRPATLVIVPEDPRHEPQVIAVPPARYAEVTAMLATIGQRLAEVEDAS